MADVKGAIEFQVVQQFVVPKMLQLQRKKIISNSYFTYKHEFRLEISQNGRGGGLEAWSFSYKSVRIL